MINLKEYNNYWRRVATRLQSVGEVIPVTVDEDLAHYLSDLEDKQLPVLIVLVPESTGDGVNVDGYTDQCDGLVILGDKYDPQREGAVASLEQTQSVAEEIKQLLLEDTAQGCQVISQVENQSLKMFAITNLYNNFAGWMLSFRFWSD